MTTPPPPNLSQNLDRDFLAFRNDGDAAAMSRVFDAAAPELLRMASHLVSDRHSADDVVQATFLAAIEDKEHYDASLPVMPWLLGILGNRIRLSRRASRRCPDPTRLEAASDNDPVDAAQSGEFSEAVSHAICELPESYQAVVNLHLRSGMSAKEIAEALNCPRGTVRSQLSRGMELLRRLLPPGFAATIAGGMLADRISAMRDRVFPDVGTWPTPMPSRTPHGTAASPRGRTPGLGLGGAGVLAIGLLTAWLALPWLQGTPSHVAPLERPGVEVADAAPTETATTTAPETQRVTLASTGGKKSLLNVRATYADHSPAPDVRVLLRRTGHLGMLGAQWCTTDGLGHATFSAAASGPHLLTIANGGELALDLPTDDRVDIEIPRGVLVTGFVVDSVRQPITGANVHIALDNDNHPHIGSVTTRTDASGRFELRDVQPGRLLSASVSGRVPSWSHLVTSRVGRRKEIELRCGGPAGTIAGIIVDVDGRPVDNASVVAGALAATRGTSYGLLPSTETRSGPNGEFLCTEVPPGRVPVWIGVEGYAAFWKVVDVTAGQSTDLFAQLDRGATILGEVRDAAGRPRPNVRVRVEPQDVHPLVRAAPGWAHPLGVSDCNGHYRIPMVRAGVLRCRASAADRVLLSPILDAKRGAKLHWDPTFEDTVPCHGILVDQHGAPLPGWELCFELVDRTRRSPPLQTTTDGGGRFQVSASTQAEYEVRVREPSSATRRPLWVRGGVRCRDGMQIEVPSHYRSTSTISGTRLDPRGAPLASGMITVSWKSDRGFETITTASATADGSFVIGPLPAGWYSLGFGSRSLGLQVLDDFELPAHCELDLGKLVLEPSARITLRPRGPLAQSARSAVVSRDKARLAVPLPEGEAVVTVQPGIWDISFHGPGIALNQVRVDAAPDAEITIGPTLQRGDLLPVHFAPIGRHTELTFEWHRDAQLLSRETLRWPPGEHTVFDQVTDLVCLAPGAYQLRVTDDQGHVQEEPVLTDGEIEIDLSR